MNYFFNNMDLLTVGIAIAANLLIGFSVFFSNKNSATNKLFLLQTIILSVWSLVNYLSYQSHELESSLFLVRLVLFFAVPNSIIFLILMNTFPSDVLKISKKNFYILITICLTVMIITLSPLLFSGVKINIDGAPTPIVGVGIIPFFVVAILSLPIGCFYLIKNYIVAKGAEKKQFIFLIVGVISMFSAIIIFNFILPAFFNNSSFIALGALFTFPFVAFTSYAILKHKLFNIKVAGTALLTFALTVATFLEIIFSNDLYQIIFRSSVFVLVLVFSVLLLKGVLREVRQREQIQLLAADLTKANERLKELDQVKTEFISLATHQIRAPLTAIKGYISMMIEGDYGPIPKEIVGVLDIMRQSADTLVVIVGDFLDVSRIEQGRMKYDFKDFDLQKLVSQVVAEYEPNVQKKHLDMNYSFEQGKDYLMHGDDGKIKQVIGNIIDNSIKYTPKGHIEVSIGRKNDKILVKISDTGLGISPDVMPKLFQKFSRATSASEANILGTGLGLYIARQLVEANKGRVWAESEGESKGSQFYIELPAKG